MEKLFNKIGKILLVILASAYAGLMFIGGILSTVKGGGFGNIIYSMLIIGLMAVLVLSIFKILKLNGALVIILLLGVNLTSIVDGFYYFNMSSEYLNMMEYIEIGTMAVVSIIKGFALLPLFFAVVLQLLPMFVKALKDVKAIKLLATILYFVAAGLAFVAAFVEIGTYKFYDDFGLVLIQMIGDFKYCVVALLLATAMYKYSDISVISNDSQNE